LGQASSVAQYPASNVSHAQVPSFVNRDPVGQLPAQVFSLSHADAARLANQRRIRAARALQRPFVN